MLIAAHQVSTTKPHTLFKIISEFALEYRTTRERVIQQMQKKASHRERNKTRGKMITEVLCSCPYLCRTFILAIDNIAIL